MVAGFLTMNPSSSKIINYSLSKVLISTLFVAAAPLIAVFVDGLFTSHLIGAEQFNAVNLVLPISNFVMILTLICNMGGSFLAAKAKAVGDTELQNKYFSASLYSSVAVAWIAVVVLFFGMDRISAILYPTETGAVYVREYIGTILFYFIFLPFATTFNNMVQIEGNPSLATKFVLIANVVNILLDFIFIALLGWGLKGAAWATVFSGFVNAVLYVPYLTSERCGFRIEKLQISDFGMLKQLFAHGLGFNIFYIMTNLLLIISNNIIINNLGANGMMIYGVCTQIQSLTLCIAVGLCIGGISLITYLQGTGNQRVLQSVYKKISLVNGVFYCVLFLLMALLPQIATSVFNIDDPMLIAQARIPFICYFLYYFFFGIIAIHTSLSYQLMGHISAKAVLVLGMGALVCLLMYIFSFIDRELIWLAFPLGGIVFYAATLLYGYSFHRKNPNLTLFSLFEKYSDYVRVSCDVDFEGKAIPDMLKSLDVFAGVCELSEEMKFYINVCLGEFCDMVKERGTKPLLINVFNVSFCYKGNEFVMRIKTPGSPYCTKLDEDKINRIKHDKYNMSAEDIRTILINELPDKMDYSYSFGLNITSMCWKISPESTML